MKNTSFVETYYKNESCDNADKLLPLMKNRTKYSKSQHNTEVELGHFVF